MSLKSDRIAVSRTGGPSVNAVAGAVRASAGLAKDAKRERNLADLTSAAADGPAVQLVITGQQTGLAGGPLFSLLKAASAVAIAEKIEAESGTRTIPLFWLQSEDHDLAEVITVALPDKEGAIHPLFQAEELKQAADSRIPLESVDPHV